MARVLVVEDCLDALALAERALGAEYEVIAAKSLADARSLAEREAFDLALVDLSLPDGSGFAFCSELRSDPTHHAVPVLFLTASNQTSDKVMAFQLGAEDYVEKPFVPRELRARVDARLRRSREQKDATATIRLGDVLLDPARFRARIGGGEAARVLEFTPHEFRVLHYLAERPGQVVSRESLLESLWRPVVVSRRTIDTHVSNLRGKLLGSRVRIEGVRGVGYRLDVGPAAQES